MRISGLMAGLCLACGGGGSDGDASQSGTGTMTATVTMPGSTSTTGPTPTEGSADGTAASSGTTTMPTGTGSSGDPTTTGGAKFDLGGVPDVGMGCGGGMGGVEFSYIWVANSAQGTISKINTETLIEEGRYIVRPDSAGNPSRTSVSLSADVAVANRYGGITKVYARTADCQDTNGTPGIQTSTGAADVLAWGVEECVAWYAPMAYTTQRPLAWSKGNFNQATCLYEDQKVWTAAAQAGVGGSIVVTLLNGDTGLVEQEVPIPEVPIGGFGPYGAATDAEDNFWFVDSGNDGPVQELVRVRADDYSYKIWLTPSISPYGFTVDSKGRPWVAGYAGGVARFDPVTETFDLQPAYSGLGIQEDAQGRMWMAVYPWVDPNSVVAIDRDTMAVIKTVNIAGSSLLKGISIDFFGKVWAVDQGSSAFRIDPESGLFDVYSGLTGPYTYSDMTGWGLANVNNPQG
jgi:streptogramin lyase